MRICSFLIAPLLILVGVKAMPVQAQDENLSNIYQIIAKQCTHTPQERSLTGFLVKGIPVGDEQVDGIVTALHGVVDCESIEAVGVDPFSIDNSMELQLFAVDIDRDVALLITTASPNPLQQQAGLTPGNQAKPSESIYVVGHPYGRLDQVQTMMRLRSQPLKKLSILIPSTGEFKITYDRVDSRTSPSLKIDVLDIQGTLVPGYSGAPIFNKESQVIGVANGGLKEGTTDFVWAIPWSDICWTTVKKSETCSKDFKDPLIEHQRFEGLKGKSLKDVPIFVESNSIELSPGKVRLGVIINRTLLELKEPPVLSTENKSYLLPLPSELSLTEANIIIFNQDTEPYETLATGRLVGIVTTLSSCGGDHEFRLVEQAGSLLLTVSPVSQPAPDSSLVIQGCVYDSSTQRLITGAMIKVYQQQNLLDQGTTDNYGYYDLTNIHPRYKGWSVLVKVEAEGYQFFSKIVTLNYRHSLTVDLERIPATPTPTFTPTPVLPSATETSTPSETVQDLACLQNSLADISIEKTKQLNYDRYDQQLPLVFKGDETELGPFGITLTQNDMAIGALTFEILPDWITAENSRIRINSFLDAECNTVVYDNRLREGELLLFNFDKIGFRLGGQPLTLRFKTGRFEEGKNWIRFDFHPDSVQTVMATPTATFTITPTPTSPPNTPTPDVLESALHVQNSLRGNIYLIAGVSVSAYAVGDSLVVYDKFSGTEVAIALLRVTVENPDSLSAQAILVHPERRILTGLRVDNNLNQLSTSDLVPADERAVGYFLRTGRVRLRPHSEVQEGTILQALEPELIGDEIVDYLPFDPPIEMQVINIGGARVIASVELINRNRQWPEPGTIIIISPLPQLERMNKLFNVAVTGIGQIDGPDSPAEPSEDGDLLSQMIFDKLNTRFEQTGDLAGDVELQHTVIRYVQGNTPEDRQLTAADLAQRLNADVIIYGNIDTSYSPARFSPEFYISPSLTGAEESTGPNVFGAPIKVRLPLHNPSTENRARLDEEFVPRVEALTHFMFGLAFFKADLPAKALNQLELARQVPEWREGNDQGKEILYLWIGSTLAERARQDSEVAGSSCPTLSSAANNDLDCAMAAYKKALDLNPQFARAHIGLGNVWADQAERVQLEAIVIDCQAYVRAVEEYNKALDLEMQAAETAFVALKAHFNIGLAYASSYRYGCGDQFYELAVEELGVAIKEHEKHRELSLVRDLGTRTFYQLGLVQFQAGEYQAALDAQAQVTTIAEPDDDRYEEPWQVIRWSAQLQRGIILAELAKAGDEESWQEALAAYNRVIESYQDNKFYDSAVVSDVYYHVGLIYIAKGEPLQALEPLTASIKLMEEEVDPILWADLNPLPWAAYVALGDAHKALAQDDAIHWVPALAAYHHVVDSFESGTLVVDGAAAASAYWGAGQIYEAQTDNNKAITYYCKALSTSAIESLMAQHIKERLVYLNTEDCLQA